MIPNGVDLDKFAGGRLAEPRRALLTLGRFSHNKRLDRLLATMQTLGPGWRLRICGVPYDVSAEALTGEIDRLGLTGSVTLHLGLDVPAIRDLIGQSSLFVSASEYEGFGLALIEALSAGLIPVAHPNDAFACFGEHHPSITLTDFADAPGAAAAIRGAYDRLESGAIVPGAEDLSEYRWSSVAARYVAPTRPRSPGPGRWWPPRRREPRAEPARLPGIRACPSSASPGLPERNASKVALPRPGQARVGAGAKRDPVRTSVQAVRAPPPGRRRRGGRVWCGCPWRCRARRCRGRPRRRARSG